MRNRAGLGLLALLLFVCIFGIEAILSVMRARKLSVTVDVQDSQGVVLNATTEATEAAGAAGKATPEADAAADTLDLPMDGALVVNANWDYRIGPTFPQTLIRAQVFDAQRNVVAANQYKVNCGTNSLDCRGTAPLALNYGIVYGKGTRGNWPTGEYRLYVTHSTGDLKTFDLLDQTVVVAESQ